MTGTHGAVERPAFRSLEIPDVPVVHAVTSDEIVERADFVDVACAVMAALGSRGALHLRCSRSAGARLQELAGTLATAQRITGAWLVVNDRVDVALVAGARGAQLTTRSLTVADARRIAPRLAIGASVHSLADGVVAAREGADWIVAGHPPGGTMPGAAPPSDRGLAFVRELAQSVVVPVVAIGGIRPEHCASLRRKGVRGVAVIRGIWDAPNAERAASDYLSSYDNAGDE